MEKSLGKMIRQYRKRCGLTQEKLGELCGVTLSCISRWENDNLHPKRDNILQLAEIFNIYEADFYPASEVSIPDSVVIREFLSLLEQLEDDEKEYFLNSLRNYVALKAKYHKER